MDYGGLIWHLHKELNIEANQRLEKYGLTAQQLSLLSALHNLQDAGETVNQRRLEEELHLSNPSLTGILNRLEAKGFLTRQPDPADGRSNLVLPTEKDRLYRAETRKAIRMQEEKLTAGMSPGEKLLLMELLERMLSNISSETA